jgi:hypothetical protein
MPSITPVTSIWGNLLGGALGSLVNLGLTPVTMPDGSKNALWLFVAGLVVNAGAHALSAAQAGPLVSTEPTAGAKKS